MILETAALINKNEIFASLETYINQQGFQIVDKDEQRPWGGFFVLAESDAEKFIAAYFPHLTKKDLQISSKLSPKFLLVAPNKRLSWQYHHRRAEIWKLIAGEASVVSSDTDEEKIFRNLLPGDMVELQQGERHRLVGLENWGVVAEIWRHTSEEHPSDENDIVRVQDDFGR